MPFLRNSNNLWRINRTAEDGNTVKFIPIPFCDCNIAQDIITRKGKFSCKTLMFNFLLSYAIAYAYREMNSAVHYCMAG